MIVIIRPIALPFAHSSLCRHKDDCPVAMNPATAKKVDSEVSEGRVLQGNRMHLITDANH
ncbi:MAG: hypothetical protein H7A51_19260 [Akkermansiaceae bacterium]|nr:hypothetical protein [Akkermansiaceae bacterium]